MKLNSILNTNQWSPEAPTRVMQYEVSHYQPAHHDMSAPQYSQNLYVPNGRIKSENGSERGLSPHNNSDPSSRYSSQAPPPLHAAYQQGMTSMPNNGMRYPSPNQMHQQMPMIQHSYHPNGPTDPTYVQAPLNPGQQLPDQQSQQDGGRSSTGGSGLPKAFACSTCGKGFARRSDLARHGASDAPDSFQLT